MIETENKQKTLHIKQKIFQNLWEKGTTLFFFNKTREWDSVTRNNIVVWKSENTIIQDTIDGNEVFATSINDSILLYCKPTVPSHGELNCDLVEIEYEEFEHNNFVHIKAIFLHYLFNCKQHKYACRELLWYLNNYIIDKWLLSDVLWAFDEEYRYFLIKELAIYARCLSIPKQKIINEVISGFNGEYRIYFPAFLSDALNILYPDYDPYLDSKSSIFSLVHKTIVISQNTNLPQQYDVLKEDTISNFLLQIRRWLADDNYVFSDFGNLINRLRLFYPNQQMKILKRYFLAVEKGQTKFDIELIKKFKDNPCDNLSVYCHCMYRASKPVLIGLQLLCDTIITFVSSDPTRRELQKINGILDMAYAQCNVEIPAVDFELSKILPECNGGAILKQTGFKGFICFEIIQVLQETFFNEDCFVLELGKQIINSLSTYRYSRKVCTIYGEDFTHCEKYCENPQICSASQRCENFRVEYLDKWSFNNPTEEKCAVVNLFLRCNNIHGGRSSDISLADISTDASQIRQNIINFLESHLKVRGAYGRFPRGYVCPHPCRYEFSTLYEEVLRPVWMVIEPRNNAYIGLGLLASRIGVSLEEYGPNREGNDSIKRRETDYIKPIIINSIHSITNTPAEQDGKFYLNYDKDLLNTLKQAFYTHRSYDNSDLYTDRDLCFLQRSYTYFSSYCAPKYTGGINRVIELPYFSCRGRECYMNALAEQTVANCRSWKSYTILHMLEILGYPQVRETMAGFEASTLIQDFIATVNKAFQLFGRVICRECGHILFPLNQKNNSNEQTNNFNRYNNFECHNDICTERGKRIYLSQCYHCRRGIIDSRDSKQCPNGWRICPECLSCCTDEQIEIQAQKYERSGLPVRASIQRIRGYGHNNRNQYFCPKCGGRIIDYRDNERGQRYIYCSNCREVYPNALNWI